MDKLKNQIINSGKGRHKDWPFNDPKYIPRVKDSIREKKFSDGRTVLRTKIIHNIPISIIPERAVNCMITRSRFNMAIPRGMGFNNSPVYNKRGKRIRPLLYQIFNDRAIEMIKSGYLNEVLETIKYGFKKLYLKTVFKEPQPKLSSYHLKKN
jgi:hypothetical protein